MEEKIKIGKWNIPKKLFEDYVRFQTLSEGYLSNSLPVPSINPESKKIESSMRWQMCVQKVMELHREICKAIGVEYSSDEEDEFYIAFKKEVRKQTRLKG